MHFSTSILSTNFGVQGFPPRVTPVIDIRNPFLTTEVAEEIKLSAITMTEAQNS